LWDIPGPSENKITLIDWAKNNLKKGQQNAAKKY